MPAGSLPGGLVTLQQYLDANQPAVDRTQGALDQSALQPYTQALSGVQQQVQGAATNAAAQAQQAAQQQADRRAQTQAIAGARRAGPGGDPSTGTASIPYSSSLASNPQAQATLSNAQTSLDDARAKATNATTDPGARANTLYGIYGSALAGSPGGLGYNTSMAGFDAALTKPTSVPGGGEVQNMINASPTTSGTATASRTATETIDQGNGPGEGPFQKPRREFEVNP